MAATISKSRLSEGSPNPLGATWDGLGVNFSLFSANATKVELCLFDDAGAPNSSASNCRNTPTKSGTAICRTRDPAPSMATACMVRTIHASRPSFQPEQAVA